jgi:hypothetical protein
VPTFSDLVVFINDKKWPQRHPLSGGSIGPPAHVPPAPPAPGGGPHAAASRPASLDRGELSIELAPLAGPRKRPGAAPRAFFAVVDDRVLGLTLDILKGSALAE